MRRPRRATLGALTLALVLSGAACSDDDDPVDATESEDTGAESEDTSAATEDTAAVDEELVTFCDRFAELAGALQGGEAPSPEEGEALVAGVEETAPEDVAEPVAAVVAGAREYLAGNEEAFDDDFFASVSTIDGFRYDSCPTDEKIEVTGVEYAFEGAPDTIPAGTVGFKLLNEGAEEHEMIVFARAEGETRSFEELANLPDDEAEQAVRFVGAAHAPPGAEGVLIADLEPGDYAMACFIPVGGGEEGPPHVHEGMLHEFTVT